MSRPEHSWSALRAFMRERCGVLLDDEQRYLMSVRLSSVARALSFDSVDAYVLAACQADAPPTLHAPLVDAMTTHETSFFRDARFWRELQAHVLPRLSRLPGPLSVWCAACSTGQEVWSLAMALASVPSLASRTTIVATDVSRGVLDVARSATYSEFELKRGLSAEHLTRFFERGAPDGWRVKPELRRRVTWAQHNLVTEPFSGGPFELVLARNVLIYFSEEIRRAVVDRVASHLRPGGFLGVGSTEVLRGPSFSQAFGPGWYTQTL